MPGDAAQHLDHADHMAVFSAALAVRTKLGVKWL